MKYLTSEDFKIFEQERALYKKMIDAKKKWEALKTESSFEEYCTAHKNWQKFHREHSDVLLAKEVA
jgi:hypothetical protein